MKGKLLNLALGLIATTSLFGQWTENFDASTSVPTGWTVINGGSPNTWIIGAPSTGAANSGTNVAKLTYNSAAHNDYLVTKAITVTAGVSDYLTFFCEKQR